jgi:hypothetical protein
MNSCTAISGLKFYKSSKIFLVLRSNTDPVTGEMDGHPPSFRKWSIFAFVTESIIVILAFLFMIFFLKWEINTTMMYLLLLVMVISAVLLLITGRTTVKK